MTSGFLQLYHVLLLLLQKTEELCLDYCIVPGTNYFVALNDPIKYLRLVSVTPLASLGNGGTTTEGMQ